MLLRPFGTRYHVRVLDGNRLVAEFRISRPGLFGRRRTISLEYLNSRSPEDLPKDRVYDNWSRPVLVGITNHRLYILDQTWAGTWTCSLPTDVQLKWRRGSLRVSIDAPPNAGARVRFARPWRHVSPLPEKGVGDIRQLVVTRLPQPNDRAFLLPLGGGLPDPRAPLWITETSGRPEFAHQVTLDDALYGAANEAEAVASETSIRAGTHNFLFALSSDVLHPGGVLLHLFMAVLAAGAGLLLLAPRTENSARWIVAGLASVVFVLLVFRITLAVRYAVEPQFIDDISVKGIVLSLFAATLLPGLILLEARLRLDGKIPAKRGEAKRAAIYATGYLALILCAALLQLRAANSTWPALPGNLAPSRNTYLLTTVILTVVAARTLWLIRRAYFLSGRKKEPIVSYERFAENAQQFWTSVSDRREGVEGRWYGIVAGIFIAVLFGLALVMRIPGLRVVQEVLTPLLFTLLPALLWLSAARYYRDNVPGRPMRSNLARDTVYWTKHFFWAALTVGIPVLGIPFAIGDPGSILATAAVFLPMLAILTMADRGLRAALVTWICIGMACIIALVSYFEIESLYPVMQSRDLGGNVPARVMAFKRDDSAQQDILRLSRGLEEAYTHTWENKAIAHEGGAWGMGFSKAPTRRSHVAQDTLQYDSVFSFFVASEYGLVGALALMLIYAVPIALFIITTRGQLSLATAFGLVICTAFFLEAWFHAAMNVGTVPFAGRNLPLMSVHSGSDVLKWLCLLVIAAGTPFWKSDAIISLPRRRVVTLVATGVPLLLVVLIAYGGVSNLRDARLAEHFTWDSLLQTVSALTREGKLTLNPRNEIVMASDIATEDSLLTQQVRAFNQLPLNERLGETYAPDFLPRLLAVRTPDGYQSVLRSQAAAQIDRPAPYPPLFRLVAEPETLDDLGFLGITSTPFRIEPNPEFNTRISFRPRAAEDDLPRIFLPGQAFTSFLLQGGSFAISVPQRAYQPHEMRTVHLTPTATDLTMTLDDNPRSPRGDVFLRPPAGQPRPFVRFTVEQGKFLFIENKTNHGLRVRRGATDVPLPSRRRIQVFPGDRVHLSTPTAIDPGFTVFPADPAPLIGPAWVMGRWRVTYDSHTPLPWTPYLVTALDFEWDRRGVAEAKAKYQMLTIDSALQQAAQSSTTLHGRELHQRRLNSYAAVASRTPASAAMARLQRVTQNAHPPRVALSVISIPDGAVLAMAGWPRAATGDIGAPCTMLDHWCPPTGWLDRMAPSAVRTRFGGDRNFDRIEMGSSTKPLLAAAALATHPGIERLHVTGPSEIESELFGIRIPGKTGWEAHFSPRWTNFERFLGESDNRYQVRLGFLALAERGPNGELATEPARSPSVRESMDGANEWRRYPRYPTDMEFSFRKSDEMVRIDDTLFARKIRSMYGVGVKQGELRTVRYSFWSLNGADDLAPGPVAAPPQPGTPPTRSINRAFDVISPEAANLGFDTITNPRQYVSLLLGGNENRWANVDFAGGFGTAVTGHPVMPHILSSKTAPVAGPNREHFPRIAAKLRPGLAAVINSGTAAFARGNLLPPALASIPGIRIYGKTGTLAVSGDGTTTSRLVIAIVRWTDETNGVVKKGVVLSFVGEKAQMGDATRWLGEYVRDNQAVLARYLR
ncbi:MAG TPA: FtsW/RodA/SpoVE family cell cycle protein [Gemmatimonadaceae bacterium]